MKKILYNLDLKKHFSLLCVFFVLTSCGFHLHGAYNLPEQLNIMHIQAKDPNSELVNFLKQTLKTNNVVLLESSAPDSANLMLGSEIQEKRVLSVDSKGRAREYEINYQLSFSVSTENNTFSMSKNTIKLQREFLFDTDDVLGKSREQDTLIRDMQQDMVRLIMLRLQAAAN